MEPIGMIIVLNALEKYRKLQIYEERHIDLLLDEVPPVPGHELSRGHLAHEPPPARRGSRMSGDQLGRRHVGGHVGIRVVVVDRVVLGPESEGQVELHVVHLRGQLGQRVRQVCDSM